MKYELAKELKDAGFPQEGENFDADGEMIQETDPKNWREWAYVPSLEELIEECGGKFLRVENYTHLWRATGVRDPFEHDISCDGATPTEAVARLWLALNKKVAPQKKITMAKSKKFIVLVNDPVICTPKFREEMERFLKGPTSVLLMQMSEPMKILTI